MTTIIAGAQLLTMLLPIAADAGVDWRVARTIIEIESRGDPTVGNAKIGIGLMGVMPHALETEADLWIPENNIMRGCARLRVNMDYSPGDLRRALVSYHMGIAGAEQAGWLSSQDGGDYLARFTEAWGLLFPGQALPWERKRPTLTGEKED